MVRPPLSAIILSRACLVKRRGFARRDYENVIVGISENVACQFQPSAGDVRELVPPVRELATDRVAVRWADQVAGREAGPAAASASFASICFIMARR